MVPFSLHFKLNGAVFDSTKALQTYAENLLNKEETLADAGKFILEWLNEAEAIYVQTSGSTGVPKKIKLLKIQVCQSAYATIDFFQLSENTTALICLSPKYIAGKMMLVRAMLGGWDVTLVPPSTTPLKNLNATFDFCAMVPLQVFHSLKELNKIRTLIVGGGIISYPLEKALQSSSAAVYATYGMTETISHVALRRVNGADKSVHYKALSGISFSVNKEHCLKIDAPRISDISLQTNDVVQLIDSKEFEFLGRKDNVINSGGIKIFPEKIELKLAPFLSQNFFISSEKDDALGEKVIIIIEKEEVPPISSLDKVFSVLDPYEKPKAIYAIKPFLYTETEKIKRQAILEQLNLRSI